MSLKSLHGMPEFVHATTVALSSDTSYPGPIYPGPACLYNGMIAPLTPMTIQGVIWYQGESNVGRPYYSRLFRTMIADWRRAFERADMPFYFVQIAPLYYNRFAQVAELREAQAEALQLKNTGMALSLDVSYPGNIHPNNKREVGRRLAWQALAKTYGHTEITADGPTPESTAAQGGRLRIVFRDVGGGLISRDGKPLTCFEIAGKNGTFVRAEAVIDGNAVVVFSAAVAQPKAVRFAWGEADVPNLASRNGLPVAQFRASVK
jgi:sialate O-acetylesterase